MRDPAVVGVLHCQHFIGVRSFYKTCVRDDVLLRNPAEFVDAPTVDEEGQKGMFLTPLKFAAFLEVFRQTGAVEHAAVALMGLSGLRVAETCSRRVESLRQDGGYDSIRFVGKGGRHPAARAGDARSASSWTAGRQGRCCSTEPGIR